MEKYRFVSEADTANGKPITCTLFARVYGPQGTLYREAGPSSDLASGTEHIFEWRLPETNGSPIAEIGLELSAHSRANGTLYLDYLSWGGSPDMLLTRAEGTMWKRAWVEGISRLDTPAILAEQDFIWKYDCRYQMRLEVSENRVRGWIDDLVQFDVWDRTNPLESGGIALVIQEGCQSSGSILVTPS